ncbi:MAG: heavy metal translocating P-type ATPase [Victivallaceae bacterium]|nr:cation-translocating P-type ATPase [Victivallaceae bacterium]
MEKFEEWFENNVVWLLAVSAAGLAASFFFGTVLPVDPAWLVVAVCGLPIALESLEGLFTRFDVTADLLVFLALIGAIVAGETFAAGEVAFIMVLGEQLEHHVVNRARAGIGKLLKMMPDSARVIRNGIETMVPASEVAVGDRLRVLAGESVPVDGVVLSGASAVDESALTGEPVPADKTAGDRVLGGSVNRFGVLEVEAVADAKSSSLERMVRLVESVDADKAKIVSATGRWASWMVVAALIAALAAWGFTGDFVRAVSVMVVFCPCALVLATPAAIMAGIGNAARHGILIRRGDALERLAGVNVVAFDKTGTLTGGRPEVFAFEMVDRHMSDSELRRKLAALESCSEHPLGKAVADYCSAGIERHALPAVDGFRLLPGRGAAGNVEGSLVVAGNARLMAEHRIPVPGAAENRAIELMRKGATVIYIAVDGVLCGMAALADALRPASSRAVSGISGAGCESLLVSGDQPGAVAAAAEQAGIISYHAGCLPENKLEIIAGLQRAGKRVCMVGDGINDAPALAAADAGVAMGGAGSDLAIETADAVLVRDDLSAMPHLLRLSARTLRVIRWNIGLSLGLNFAAVAAAVAGLLPPFWGALVHNAGAMAVVLNAVALYSWRGMAVPPDGGTAQDV